MDQLPGDDVQRFARDLNESRDPSVRRMAVEKLAAMPAEERTVRALLGARFFDLDPSVRSVAEKALASAAVQEFMAGQPELAKQAAEMRQFEPPAPADIQALIRREYERRRQDQVRMSYVVFAILIVLFVVMWTQIQPWAPLAFVLTFGLVLGYLLFTWQNWRCPKCRGHLWFSAQRVDPWKVKGEVACPHCGMPLRLG